MGSTLKAVFVKPLEKNFLQPGDKKMKTDKPSLDALRIKKSRMRKRALCIYGLHKDRTRFLTMTTIDVILDRKKFLYMRENAFKALRKAGYEIKSTACTERQDGKRRKDKKGRMSWHTHELAYRVGGVSYRGFPAWDYKKMNEIIKPYGLHFWNNKIGKSTNACSQYMQKGAAVAAASYAAKVNDPKAEEFFYTLTSKGCDLPKSEKIYDEEKAREFMSFGNYHEQKFEKDGKEFVYYLSENSKFCKADYFDWDEKKINGK